MNGRRTKTPYIHPSSLLSQGPSPKVSDTVFPSLSIRGSSRLSGLSRGLLVPKKNHQSASCPIPHAVMKEIKGRRKKR